MKLRNKEQAKALRAAIPYLAPDTEAYDRAVAANPAYGIGHGEACGMCAAIGAVGSDESHLKYGLTDVEAWVIPRVLINWVPNIFDSRYKPEHYTFRVMWLELMAIMAETGEDLS